MRGLHFTLLETSNFLCYRVELDHTSKLGAFFEETKGDSPEVRAEKLEAHKAISEVHDEVARQGQTSAPSLDDKVDFHFIAFVEHDGRLYELDGRKSGPVDCGKIEADFLTVSVMMTN